MDIQCVEVLQQLEGIIVHYMTLKIINKYLLLSSTAFLTFHHDKQQHKIPPVVRNSNKYPLLSPPVLVVRIDIHLNLGLLNYVV
jgi:hypothetical protein